MRRRQAKSADYFAKRLASQQKPIAAELNVSYLFRHMTQSSADRSTESYQISQLGDELASVEYALRQIIPADLEEKILATIPKWFLLMDMFKKLEIPYARLLNRKSVEPRYRAVLVTLMAYGENIVAGLEMRPGIDLSPIKCSQEIIDFNVRYLRDKYEQWFAPGETSLIETDLRTIQHARARTA